MSEHLIKKYIYFLEDLKNKSSYYDLIEELLKVVHDKQMLRSKYISMFSDYKISGNSELMEIVYIVEKILQSYK